MEIYIFSIVSAIVGYFSSIFANRRIKGILSTIGALFILAGISVTLTYFGLWVITPAPIPPPPPVEREKDILEGQWVEWYEEGKTKYCAVATIRYNSEAKYMEFFGNAYAPNLVLIGRWRTMQAARNGNQYDYLYEGESWNLDRTKRGLRKGVGGIWFDTGNHGKGKFFSIESDKELREFELYRILDEDAAKLSVDDITGFIQKLYEDPNYLKKITTVQ